MNRRRVPIAALAASALLLASAGSAAADPLQVSGLTVFAPGCGGQPAGVTLFTNAEVQPQLSVDPENPDHLVGTYQQDRWSDIGSRGVVAITSFDGGRSWRRATPPLTTCAGGTVSNGAYDKVLDAWATVGPGRSAYLASLSITGGIFDPASAHAINLVRSGDGGRTWGAPVTLVQEAGSVLNDFPTVTADPTDGRYVYVLWCRIAATAQGLAGPVYLDRSTDGGRTWEQPRVIFDAGPGHYAFVNKIEVLRDGTLVLAFASIFEDPVTFARDVEAVAIRSTDKGSTWSAPVTISDVRSRGGADPDTGTPILDAGFVVHSALDGRGVLYTAWQDSRFSAGARDGIALSRSLDGGRTWSAPVRVNADPSVPAFSLDLAARPDGVVGVSYHDFRPNTPDPATLPTAFWLATSRDGGQTWSDQRVAGPFDLAVAPTAVISGATLLYMGAQYGLVGAGGSFVSLFGTTGAGLLDDRTDLYVARLNRS